MPDFTHHKPLPETCGREMILTREFALAASAAADGPHCDSKKPQPESSSKLYGWKNKQPESSEETLRLDLVNESAHVCILKYVCKCLFI